MPFCRFYTEIAIFSCILTKLPPNVSATMPGVKHPVGAPQLGISAIVLDIFRFHQSKWLQFSIKMLNLGQGLRELGRKCAAVSIDDKWPSFESVNREIRARLTCPAGFIFLWIKRVDSDIGAHFWIALLFLRQNYSRPIVISQSIKSNICFAVFQEKITLAQTYKVSSLKHVSSLPAVHEPQASEQRWANTTEAPFTATRFP